VDREEERRRRIVTLVRFAVRTGRFVAGETGARIAVRRGKAGVLLLAADIAPAKAERIRAWAAEASVAVFSALDGGALAEAAGRGRCDVFFVHDPSLARSLSIELGGGGGFC